MAKTPKISNNQAAWSGIVLVVVTFMLIGVYFLRLGSTELVSYDIDPNLVTYKSKVAKAIVNDEMMEYVNADYNFKVKYSDQSQLTTKSSAEGEIEIFTVEITEDNDIVKINTMPVEMEGVVRTSINSDIEESISLKGTTATRLDGSSIKDGSVISLVIIENSDNLITIEGTGQNFEDIVSYFELI